MKEKADYNILKDPNELLLGRDRKKVTNERKVSQENAIKAVVSDKIAL